MSAPASARIAKDDPVEEKLVAEFRAELREARAASRANPSRRLVLGLQATCQGGRIVAAHIQPPRLDLVE